jgi:hypothetical protein
LESARDAVERRAHLRLPADLLEEHAAVRGDHAHPAAREAHAELAVRVLRHLVAERAAGVRRDHGPQDSAKRGPERRAPTPHGGTDLRRGEQLALRELTDLRRVALAARADHAPRQRAEQLWLRARRDLDVLRRDGHRLHSAPVSFAMANRCRIHRGETHRGPPRAAADALEPLEQRDVGARPERDPAARRPQPHLGSVALSLQTSSCRIWFRNLV